jgi:1-acyl-sn-glycerol-3-phosphate acyltransferase
MRRSFLLLTGAQAKHQQAPPQEACVYFANHNSHGDFMLVWSVLPHALRARTRPVAGADYWNKDPIRRFIGKKVVRAVLIEREKAKRAVDAIAQMREVLDAGSSLIFFPEGTRNMSDASLLPFKSGLYHLAQQRPETPLVPVWLDNLHRVLPKGEFIPVPLLCTLHFGAPIHLCSDESKAEFLDRARAALLALRPNRA